MFGWELKKKAKKKKPKKLPMEFSKKILFVTCIFAVVTFGYAMWIQYLIITKDYVGDTGIVLALIGVAGGEIVTASGFYYKKAEKENLEKEKRLTLKTEKALENNEEEPYDEYIDR